LLTTSKKLNFNLLDVANTTIISGTIKKETIMKQNREIQKMDGKKIAKAIISSLIIFIIAVICSKATKTFDALFMALFALSFSLPILTALITRQWWNCVISVIVLITIFLIPVWGWNFLSFVLWAAYVMSILTATIQTLDLIYPKWGLRFSKKGLRFVK